MTSRVAGLEDAKALSPRLALRGASGPIRGACYLRDGRFAVCSEPYVHVAGAASGERLETIVTAGKVAEIAASLDGNVLAIVDSLGTISISRGPFAGIRDRIADTRAFRHIAVDRTGTRMIAAYENAAAIFDLAFGTALFDLRGHRAQPAQERGEACDAASVVSVAMSADGAIAVTGGTDETAIVWDTATGAPLHFLASHDGTVFRVAIDPKARTIATFDSTRVLRTWDVRSGRCLLRHAMEGPGAIALAFDAAGDRLAVMLDDGTLAIFVRHVRDTLAWWQPARAYAGPAPDWYGTTLAFDGTGTSVLVAGPRNVAPNGGWLDDSCVRIVDATTGASREYRFEGGWTTSLSISPDGATVIAGGARAQRWNANDGSVIDATAFPPSWKLTYAPDGRRIAAVLASGKVVVLDESGATLVEIDPEIDGICACWTPDGKHLVVRTGISADPLVVCDASSGAAVARPAGGKQATFCGFGSDGTLVFGDRDGVDAFEPHTWTKRWTLAGPLQCCAFAPSSSVFFVGDGATAVAVHDIATGNVRTTIDVGERPNAIVAAPSGTWFVTSGDGPMRVWSVARARIVATLNGLIEGCALSIAFSAAERRIAVNLGTARDFGSAAVFDLSDVAS